jgi:hypothetical protein
MAATKHLLTCVMCENQQVEKTVSKNGKTELRCRACGTEHKDSDNVIENKKHVFHVAYGDDVKWPKCPTCKTGALYCPDEHVSFHGVVIPIEDGSAYAICMRPMCKGGAILKFHFPEIC